MALSNSVIRRYTPPTCTLEVLAQNSPLSRWMGKSVLKHISFELCFDDPRQAETAKQVIRGDREQLEVLCTTVTNYVQECLQKSPENFWVNACGEKDNSLEVSEGSEYTDIQQASPPNNTFTSLKTQAKTANIHLKPGDNLTHNLFLGNLANQGTNPVINLSVLQLFDLANALDEYSSDVMALPNLHQEKPKPVLNLIKWAPVAAVMAIAVGLAPLTLQYARNQQKTQTAEKPATNPEEKTALSTVPSINFSASPNPGLTPSDNLILPGVKSTSSPAPNPATPNTSLPAVPSSTGAVKVPTAPQASVSTANLPNRGQVVIPTPKDNNKIANKPGSIAAIPSNRLSVPAQPNIAKSRAKPPSQSASPNFNITNNKPLNDILASNPNSQLKKPVIPPTTIGSPPSISSAAKPPAITNQNNSNSVVARLRQSRNKPPEKVATGTLFDTAQVAEARNYFKKHWQPPSSLKTALEYSLMVAADGKIERIEPLNKAARDYVDRSGMPLIGEDFISPNKNGKSIRIRTVLRPDGSVQTLPENE
ncbi:MAG: DUF4335 domain-containing protein [Calothrix sp. MO_167.B42]|nr:DUF4335 domain-containing protein [Calothrix sp. MO_167.B42]